jgi:hypothetical protein
MALLYGLVIGWSLYVGLAMLAVALLVRWRSPARGRRMLKLGAWGVLIVVGMVWLGSALAAVAQPESVWATLAGRYVETFVSVSGAGFSAGALWGLLKR